MWLNVLKVGGPILLKILGLLFTAFGSSQYGKAQVGEYSMSQQALPVYGNLGIGIGLVGAGLATQLVISHRDKKKASETPPSVPAEGVDPAIHAQVVRWMELAVDDKTSDEDLKWVTDQVILWRNRWKASRVASR